jgi:predicted cupin superfamily sugar epimerase
MINLYAMNVEARALIEHFTMKPLPVEGTYYVNTYVSTATTPAGGPAGSAIIGLFADDPPSWSCFHRLPFDEIWHVYGGDPFRLVLLHPDGTSDDVIMGSDIAAGRHIQYTVPAGTWQAGHLIAGGRYALYGCTMAPGFTAAGFEAGTAAYLTPRYPARAVDIARYAVRGDDHVMPPGTI